MSGRAGWVGFGLVMALFVAAESPAAADPAVGATLALGESLGGQANSRLGSSIYVLQPLGGGWLAGGALDGSGCGTNTDTMGTVPAIGVLCVQPTVAAHALVAVQAAPSPRTNLRLELGAGATSIFLLDAPGVANDRQRTVVPSAMVRASYLVRTGYAFGADWWLGIALDERALGVHDTRLSRSAGLVFEGRSR
jgi:hypothetical protein